MWALVNLPLVVKPKTEKPTNERSGRLDHFNPVGGGITQAAGHQPVKRRRRSSFGPIREWRSLIGWFKIKETLALEHEATTHFTMSNQYEPAELEDQA